MKYFIVDDSEGMRTMIRAMIADDNDDVFEFEDAETIIESYGRHKPDWVLMDIQLRGVNGIAAVEQLKERFPEAHVIIVTQFDDKIYRRRANEVHADGYVLKDDLGGIEEAIKRASDKL